MSIIIFHKERHGVSNLFEYASGDQREILKNYCSVAHLPHVKENTETILRGSFSVENGINVSEAPQPQRPPSPKISPSRDDGHPPKRTDIGCIDPPSSVLEKFDYQENGDLCDLNDFDNSVFGDDLDINDLILDYNL